MKNGKRKLLGIAALCGLAFGCAGPELEVRQWDRLEIALRSAAQYDNPVQDVTVNVEFTGPDGQRDEVLAFWDGGDDWRIRYMPDQVGSWSWRTVSSDESNSGLNGQSGRFQALEPKDDRALFRHGRLRVSDDGYRLIHADGVPFFWLACTAWNGPLFSDDASWEEYLGDRAAKGFTAIQFVTTQWRGGASDSDGRQAYTNDERIEIDPEFFQRLDGKVDSINAHGLLAAPVMLWALPYAGDQYSPGIHLSDDQAVVLTRYLKARYGAHHVLWFLGGDGHYTEESGQRDRWLHIGRETFGQDRAGARGLATLHPGGGARNWCRREYIDEPWYSLVGYQSSHSVSEGLHRWVLTGAPATEWKQAPAKPVINLEPAYDGIKEGFDDYVVRRITYWSTLVSPTAGVSYGAHSIWSWALEAGQPPLNHGNTCNETWREAMDFPSSSQMGYLRKVFEMVRWWDLYPVPELVTAQPGVADIQQWVAASATRERDQALVYTPTPREFAIDLSGFRTNLSGQWFDPRAGTAGETFPVEAGAVTLRPPGESDWLLVLKGQ